MSSRRAPRRRGAVRSTTVPNASTTGTPLGQLVQQAVLAQDEALGGLLDREDLVVRPDEPDDVPGDAAGHLDDPRVGPVGKGLVEGEVEQLGRGTERREGVVGHVGPAYAAASVGRIDAALVVRAVDSSKRR